MPSLPSRSGPAAKRGAGAVFSPLYRQIKQLLLTSLERGEWKPGEAIPSEFELAARFQVSQGTMRKAIDDLAAENLLVRRQGRGTFVATHHEPRAQFRFLRLVPDVGEPVPAESRFLDCKRIKPPAEIAAALGLRSNDATVYMRRVLYFGGTPLVLDDIWLPGSLFKGLSAERLGEYRGPLYGLFESEFDTRMIRAEERIKAVVADADAAPALGVAIGSALLLVDRTSYTYGDRPVEIRRGRCVTLAHHYRNTLF
jgi:GntR family transcriptional regulator